MDKFKEVKHSQIAQYNKKAREYRRTGNLYLFYVFVASLLIVFLFFSLETASDGAIFAMLLFMGAAVVFIIIVLKLRRHAVKSATLLKQLVFELQRALQGNNLEKMKSRVLTVETNFLSNDDELYTKKFIWKFFLEYLDIKMIWDKDEKERRMDSLRGRASNIPAVWMRANPLNIDNRDRNFVQLNWELKLRLRELFFKNSGTQRVILEDLGREAKRNSIVYERFLRNKKVSKKLKKFKRVAWVFYLSAAAKMKLIYFVDSVLQDRPYVEQCDEMVALTREKNEQISKYTNDFWRIHRRSLKFYLFEMIWLALLVPVLIIAGGVFYISGMRMALLTFYVGAGIVVAGEMVLVTRQLRDLKSKKLVPSLIAALMGIRHSMCCSVGANPEVAKRYKGYFKESEKRFMLTVTEVEAVKYAKENVTEKVFEKLSDECLVLRADKDKQAHKYYERFNYYRGQCLKYGALEAFVGLLVIPVVFFSFYRTAVIGGLFMEIYLEIGFIIVGLLVELVLLVRHIRVDRRKELFLLIYQKMSVILSDYTIFSDVERLRTATGELEDSILSAAAADGMQDVVDYVRNWQIDGRRNTEQVVDQLMGDVGKVVKRIPSADQIEKVVRRKKE